MSRSSFGSWRALASGLLLGLLLAQATGHLTVRAVDAIDAFIYDLRLRAFATERTDERIAVIDIDERSLAEFGRWPWHRGRLAALVERLFEREGVLLLGLDMILAEPDAPDADRHFAETLARHPVVLGFQLNALPGAVRSGVLPPGMMMPAWLGDAALPPWHGYAGSLDAFQQAAAGGGFLNAVIDDDGITRRAPLLAVYDGQVQVSLPLAIARVLLGQPALQLQRAQLPLGAPGPLEAVLLPGLKGMLRIPVDMQGRVLMPYPAEDGRVRHVSAADVLAGRIGEGALRGCIVLVGTAAAGLMDQHATPTGSLLTGVELHANVLSALLDGRMPQAPAYAPAATAVLLLVSGLALIVLLPRLALLPATILCVVLALLLVTLNAAAWANAQVALPLAAPLLLVLGLYGLQPFFGQLAEALAKRRLAALFSQYVPPELVELMSQDPQRYSMAGRNAELSVLFADVRGFTTFSERLPPDELAALMNCYFSVMTDVVRAHRGTLDKYVGDALMAFWGAPVYDSAHALHAVQAALAMQAALPALNKEFAARGWPALRITIGINTGTMVVGDMGSRHRRAYTVLGDAVNVAARLQELSGTFEIPVVIGPATRTALAGWPCREIDRVVVRGRSERITIYEPLAPDR